MCTEKQLQTRINTSVAEPLLYLISALVGFGYQIRKSASAQIWKSASAALQSSPQEEVSGWCTHVLLVGCVLARIAPCTLRTVKTSRNTKSNHQWKSQTPDANSQTRKQQLYGSRTEFLSHVVFLRCTAIKEISLFQPSFLLPLPVIVLQALRC